MLQKLQKRKNQLQGSDGFTIIEVLIVLAIAGLILLIVFLAVPALQRSSRNTQRKNDASSISSAVANFISNNGGTVPAFAQPDAAANTVDICASSGKCGATDNKETAKVGLYDSNKVTFGSAAPTDADSVVIVKGKTCNANNTGLGGTSSRTAAILYAVETGSGVSQQCVEQ